MIEIFFKIFNEQKSNKSLKKNGWKKYWGILVHSISKLQDWEHFYLCPQFYSFRIRVSTTSGLTPPPLSKMRINSWRFDSLYIYLVIIWTALALFMKVSFEVILHYRVNKIILRRSIKSNSQEKNNNKNNKTVFCSSMHHFCLPLVFCQECDDPNQ